MNCPAVVGVVDRALGGLARRQSHPERVDDELLAHVRGHAPADDPAAEQILHRSEVQPPLTSPDLLDVRRPHPFVRGGRSRTSPSSSTASRRNSSGYGGFDFGIPVHPFSDACVASAQDSAKSGEFQTRFPRSAAAGAASSVTWPVRVRSHRSWPGGTSAGSLIGRSASATRADDWACRAAVAPGHTVSAVRSSAGSSATPSRSVGGRAAVCEPGRVRWLDGRQARPPARITPSLQWASIAPSPNCSS